jgi:hypothetical protein
LGRPLDLQAHPYSLLARLAGHRAYEANVFPKTAIHLDNDIVVASGRHPGPWPKDYVFTLHAWCRQPTRARIVAQAVCGLAIRLICHLLTLQFASAGVTRTKSVRQVHVFSTWAIPTSVLPREYMLHVRMPLLVSDMSKEHGEITLPVRSPGSLMQIAEK